jgi:hypothetical protein
MCLKTGIMCLKAKSLMRLIGITINRVGRLIVFLICSTRNASGGKLDMRLESIACFCKELSPFIDVICKCAV